MFRGDVQRGTSRPTEGHMNDMLGYVTGALVARDALLRWLDSYIIKLHTHISA